VVYNPTAQTRSFRLSLRALTGDRYRVSTGAGVVDRDVLNDGLPLSLSGHVFHTIDIEEAPA